MAKARVTGADDIRKNLKLADDLIKKGILKGMITAARVIQRDVTIEGDPTVPLDIGNLRASFFISTILGVKAGGAPRFRITDSKTGHKLSSSQFALLQSSHNKAVTNALAEVKAAKNITVILGYGANYAIWVHEMEGDIHWSKEGTGAKWFEKSLKRNKNVMLKFIGTSARISSIKGFGATKNLEARTEIEDIGGI